MNFIINNPYRILGLSIFSNEREITKRISNLNIELETGFQPSFDYDFPFIKNFNRDLKTVDRAAKQIEKDNNRLFYSIFWFHFNGTLDAIIKDLFSKQQFTKAIDLLEKALKIESNPKKKFLLKKNLMILYLELSFNRNLLESYLEKSVKYFHDIISSDYWKTYVFEVTNFENYDYKTEVLNTFVEDFIEHIYNIVRKNSKQINSIINIFRNNFPILASTITNQFISLPTLAIDKKKQKIDTILEQNPLRTFDEVKKFKDYCEPYLTFIKNILNPDSIEYRTISDDISHFMLNHAISLFNRYRNSSDYDPGFDSNVLINYAEEMALSDFLKKRVNKNKEILKNWINKGTDRRKQSKISEHVKNIEENMQFLKNKRILNDFFEVNEIIKNTSKQLINIYSKIGKNDPFSIKITNAVVKRFIDTLNDFASAEKHIQEILTLKEIFFPLYVTENIEKKVNRFFNYIDYIKK